MKKILLLLLLLPMLSQAQIITTIAGNGIAGFSGDGGPAINAEFNFPVGVGADKWGNIYVADVDNNIIQKIDTSGTLTRFAGSGASGLGGDGGLATAAQLELSISVGIVADSIGNIYFADGSRVRMVTTSGIIKTIAGSNTSGNSGDGGPATAAEFDEPTGLCFDKAGNLYIADFFNSNIRMVNTAGIISTFAGTTIGFSGDGGPATNAQFKSPDGIAIDDSGNMFIADPNVGRVRKIDAAGIITTIAGGDSFGTTVCAGTNCPATSMNLYGVVGISVDHSGNIYTSTIVYNAVHKISKNGLVHTIAGNGTADYSGDGGPASNAMLNAPAMICLDNSGNLLITDKDNIRYRKVWLNPATYVSTINSPVRQFSFYPNPVTNHNFTCKITTPTNEKANITITNTIGQHVFTSTCTTNTATNFSINVPPGIYFITATTKESKINKKLVVE